jgi:hypothetical protein
LPDEEEYGQYGPRTRAHSAEGKEEEESGHDAEERADGAEGSGLRQKSKRALEELRELGEAQGLGTLENSTPCSVFYMAYVPGH